MKPQVSPLGSAARRLLLLAPDRSEVPGGFQFVEFDSGRHADLLAGMQRVRGRVYLEDGAIERWQLSSDGRHQTPFDARSWHLLVLGDAGEVCGCARYLAHSCDAPFGRLGVAGSALAQSDKWGLKLRNSIAAEMDMARKRNLEFVEVGGWALLDEVRCTTEALRIALSAYGLARLLGGCIGVTTATVRHCSAAILRKIGGRGLTWDGFELPSYYDPGYRCDMSILRFDSTAPNPRYIPWIDQLETCLAGVPVVCASDKGIEWRQVVANAVAAGFTCDAA